ncbi:hypothetical protein DY245_16295 [Streptomyces inhibens]|uniref:Uncharacterized protein n=1 Tax=Streptomyces inhibens TaxID=2293571 RepID=A0A371Q3N3_STRIH|nr:hypothetical protein DY245_16295 [Streptomyces inhibens]
MGGRVMVGRATVERSDRYRVRLPAGVGEACGGRLWEGLRWGTVHPWQAGGSRPWVELVATFHAVTRDFMAVCRWAWLLRAAAGGVVRPTAPAAGQ